MAKWDINYKVDLYGSFSRAFSGKSVELQSKLLPLISQRSVKLSIGRDIIDKIIERTSKKNIDRFGRSFTGYSQGYKESLPYKIYQKSSSVNLKLTGDMLSSMVAVDKGGSKVSIEFISDLNKAKAHGHVNGGKYRKGKMRNYPVRNFFGLPDNEVDLIVKQNVNSAAGSGINILINELSEGIGQEITKLFRPPIGPKAVSIAEMDIMNYLAEGLYQ